MFRANSNAVARNNNMNGNDDDSDYDQQQQQQTGNKNHLSEMLQAMSAEYSTSYDNEDDDVTENNNDDDDENGAIGDQDQEVDIDFKDAVEKAWEKNPDDYGDLFQLIPQSARDNNSRRIDPKFWQVSVTVPTTKKKNSRSKRSKPTTGIPAAAVVSENEKQQQESEKNQSANNDDQEEEQGMGIKEKTITIEITPEEGLEMFEQELDSCRFVYGEENVILEEVDPESKTMMRTARIQVLSSSDLDDAQEKRNTKSKGLWISFVKPVRYPIAPLEPFVEPWHNIFSFKEAQTMYTAMMEVAENHAETPCLFNMVQAATSLASTFIAEGLQMIDDSKRDYVAEMMKKAGYNVRLGHEKLSPSYFTGPVNKFLHQVPKGYDVMYVENVMRVDLAKRFESMQRHLFKIHVASRLHRAAANANQNAEAIVAENENILKTNPALAALCESRCVFHGTRMNSMDNIVAKGLIVPGTDKKSEVRTVTGSRYGRGIYSTPSIDLALWYAEHGRRNDSSVKILVCAVLQGKPNVILDGHEPWGGGLQDPDEKGYNSHLSEDGEQIVVFNNAQILPCYVLHLMERRARKESEVADLGRGDKTDEVKRELRKIKENFGLVGKDDFDDDEGTSTRLRELEMKRKQGAAGAAVMKKKAGLVALAEAERKKLLTALAKKNLPFGFGPAGGNFVVEEIGEYSDDDEDFDEYVGVGEHEYAEAYEEYQHAREYDHTAAAATSSTTTKK